MSDITTTKTVEWQENDQTVTMTKTFVSRLINGCLFVNLLKTNDDGSTEEILCMEQSWRPNPDGSRSNWIDDNDAAMWLESIKNTNL